MDNRDPADEERVVELREEQLVAHKELRDLGEVIIRTEIDRVPARLEVDALREEVEVVHEPVGKAVSEREQPREADGALIVPVYEEQLVVTRRLVLRERLHIRRISTTERQLFEDTVQRERLVIEDPQKTGMVHEVYPTDEVPADAAEPERTEGGFLTRIVTRALE